MVMQTNRYAHQTKVIHVNGKAIETDAEGYLQDLDEMNGTTSRHRCVT